METRQQRQEPCGIVAGYRAILYVAVSAGNALVQSSCTARIDVITIRCAVMILTCYETTGAIVLSRAITRDMCPYYLVVNYKEW
jgi:hypothetical protein